MAYDFNRLVDRRCSDSTKWHQYGDGVLPLWVADMDFCSPQAVIDALHARVAHGVFGYGQEPPELRAVVVAWLKTSYGWDVSPDALIFIPGVMTGFNMACRALTAPGDGVLLQTPVYHPFLHAPANAGCVLNPMELTYLPDGSYAVDWDRFEAAITSRTRIFALCNPHNPVGRVFRRDELERMAEICLRHNIVILSDEIHCDLIFSGHRHLPIASLSPEVAAHTITLMAPTKTFNIAGLKCSLAIVENAELRDQFCTGRVGLVSSVNVLGYAAMEAAYRDGRPWLEALLRYLEGNREYLIEYVSTCLPGLKMARPEGTYLAWLDCRQVDLPGGPFQFFLARARVAMNEGATFGSGGEGFLRLNFGCPRATLAEALDRMKRAIDGVRDG